MTNELFYENDLGPEAVGMRLAVLRTMLGLKQKTFAERCGIPATQYNELERGKYRPGLEKAADICREFGVTLDFIFLGNLSTLRNDTANALQAIRKNQIVDQQASKVSNIDKLKRVASSHGSPPLKLAKRARIPKH